MKYDKMSENQKKKKLEIKIIRKMKKCLKFGTYSKAYKATELTETILMDQKNYKLFKSKFIENEREYKDCIINKIDNKYKNKIDLEIIEKMINKMDAATSAGIDGISAFHLKQIWSNSNDDFKYVFRKYIERIIDADLTIFELENIAIAVAVALGKDKQTILDDIIYERDIRPLMIATIFVRLSVNIAVTNNMHEILQNKLSDQYGINTKDSLLLIINTFDRFCIYKNIINKQIDNNKYLGNNDDVNILKN